MCDSLDFNYPGHMGRWGRTLSGHLRPEASLIPAAGGPAPEEAAGGAISTSLSSSSSLLLPVIINNPIDSFKLGFYGQDKKICYKISSPSKD